jgi:hypothetical protein
VPSSESGEAATDGPCGDEVRDRCIAGVDFDAGFVRAAAPSFWQNMVVMRDRREVRLGRESTRWKKVFSSMLDFPLLSIESSQSDESSSSSMALLLILSSSLVSYLELH